MVAVKENYKLSNFMLRDGTPRNVRSKDERRSRALTYYAREIKGDGVARIGLKRWIQQPERQPGNLRGEARRASRHLNNPRRSAFIPEIFPGGAAVFLLCIIARDARFRSVSDARVPRNIQTPFSEIAICFMVARNVYRGPSRRAKERE